MTAETETLRAEVASLSETDAAYYQRALELMKSNSWVEAEKVLDELLSRWPGSSVEEAATELRKNTRENQAAQKYKAAGLLIDTGTNLDGAKTHLEAVANTFEDTSVASKARRDLRNLERLIAEAEEERQREARAAAQRRARAEASVELTAFSWSHRSQFAIVEGSVKNIAGNALENVTAVASCYDSNGQFVTSGNAVIDYNPILANQTSPLTVMVNWNPAMKTCRLEFKELFGGTIPVYHSWNK